MGASKILNARRLEAMLERSVGEDDETLGGARDEVRLLLPSRIYGVGSIENEVRPDLGESSEELVPMVGSRPDLSPSSEGSSSAMADGADPLKRSVDLWFQLGSSPDDSDDLARTVE
ncbi:hypothetical protein Dimus_033541, partial [Dionaea muscipula]